MRNTVAVERNTPLAGVAAIQPTGYRRSMALRTAYIDAAQRDLATQLEHAIRDRRTVLVYGSTAHRARIARAILTTETALHRPLRVTREHDRWVVTR